jgi:acetyl esterase/lipase
MAATGLSEAIPYARGAVLDVHRPPSDGARGAARPPVVLVHGCCGDRSGLGRLAEALAAAGALVLNADWAGIDADARFPAAYEEVACAVRFARARAAALGGDPARVLLAGWSDGALPAMVVATGGDTFDATRCVQPEGSARPDAVVGIAGFYGWSLPVPARYVTPRAEAFFGGPPSSAAEAWARATPYGWPVDEDEPPALLLVGVTDPLIHDARRYASAQRAAGRPVRLLEFTEAGDQSLLSPRTREGRTVVAEVLAAGGRPVVPLCDRFPGLAPSCEPG